MQDINGTIFNISMKKDISDFVIPIVIQKMVILHLKNVHHLQILQFQIVLLQLVLMLFMIVHHLEILQFQIVLLKLVLMLLKNVHHF